MFVVADVFGHLFLESGLDDLFGDRLQQPLRASQIVTLARAAATSSRTALRSTSSGVSVFWAAFRSGLTPTSALGHH